MNDSKTPAPTEADTAVGNESTISRRQVLTASSLMMLAPAVASLVASRKAGAGTAPASYNPEDLLPYMNPADPSRPPIEGPIGQALWKRADKVLPGKALFLTRSARFAGFNVMPGFIAGAEGCRIVDPDGCTYIDFTCSNGPNLLGFRNPDIEAAAAAQRAKGDGVPFFSPAMIELCERLLVWLDDFAWTVPVKRGSDATELAMRVARVATRRPGIIMFQLSYHGSNKEQSVFFEGTPRDGLEHVVPRLPWNDVAALDNYPKDAGENVAAILMSPLDQNSGLPCRFASPEFVAAIDRFRKRTGALLILDDVRAGFRLDPRGSHKAMGLDPDMMCLGKALGNGYSQAALLGKEPLRSAAEPLLYTSTTFFSAVCARAAIATVDVYERDKAFDKITRAGTRLQAGLQAGAEKNGQAISLSGPASQPTLLFADDPGQVKGETFAHEAAKRGACFHPREPLMISAAHDDEAIDEAIEIADQAFAAMSGQS